MNEPVVDVAGLDHAAVSLAAGRTTWTSVDAWAKILAMQTLGVPYPAGYDKRAVEDLRLQAEAIATTSEGRRAGGAAEGDHRPHRISAAAGHRHQRHEAVTGGRATDDRRLSSVPRGARHTSGRGCPSCSQPWPFCCIVVRAGPDRHGHGSTDLSAAPARRPDSVRGTGSDTMSTLRTDGP